MGCNELKYGADRWYTSLDKTTEWRVSEWVNEWVRINGCKCQWASGSERVKERAVHSIASKHVRTLPVKWGTHDDIGIICISRYDIDYWYWYDIDDIENNNITIFLILPLIEAYRYIMCNPDRCCHNFCIFKLFCMGFSKPVSTSTSNIKGKFQTILEQRKILCCYVLPNILKTTQVYLEKNKITP